ncbi:Mom family adenine methylcarbamoylation protein [Paractinoplanes hotanensis]|uniref:YitH acetyltransferase (GNAT) domain-containing protein n=1 Tax=Paractinoplanes hotanensis TaxID=2906497 RepID=A0ABT0Y833_9ACTN|nr:hypothetical protein [Actinoplanes hotanensis]MCM4082207.1 hypothetical protein [Actinoplanes hotanensis]
MVAVETALYDSGWCLRTTERVPSWRHISEGGFNKRRYSVLSISEEVARAFVLLHHYSRSYPGRLAYGMFEKHHLVGVAVLGEPMHPRVITKPLPTLTNRTGAELSRVVLLNEVPANAESWFVRRVLRDAATHGLRGVVAFSDPMPRPAVGMPGHVGDFYRALGLSYCGRATGRTLTFLPDGTVFPDRSAQKIRGREQGALGQIRRLVALGATPPPPGLADTSWLRDALEEVGVRKVRHLGNHRFVARLGGRVTRRRTPLGLPSEPYPLTADPEPEELLHV